MVQSNPPPERVGLVVLAAGAGTRMRSRLPKPLHTVAGVPMVDRVLRAGSAIAAQQRVIVVSPDAAAITAYLGDTANLAAVVQDPPRGTGDAVRLALASMPDIDRLVVLYCDHPLIAAESVRNLLAASRESGAKATVLAIDLPDAAGYGRIARDPDGRMIGIVERRDDDPALRRDGAEINSGMMALDAHWARQALPRIAPSAVSGEYYLTELVQRAVAEAINGEPWPVAVVRGHRDDALGVNDRADLARAECRAWERKRERLMAAGVSLRLPETIVVDEDVEIGIDTVILPHSSLLGATVVGRACVIGPAAVIQDARVGERVAIRSSTVIDSSIADDTDVGPYAHLRAGAEIGPRVHIGNYAEIKNSRLGAGVKVGHFSYLGDATVGDESNIGAGAITANFDGVTKHRTEIGRNVFIGSDTILRAPVRVGDGARTGAGSVVTHDVPAGATVVGIPARQAPGRATRNEPSEEA